MKFKVTQEQKSAFASYVRAAAATVLTVVVAGETSPKALWAAVVAAFLPPVVRWLNPNDTAFGRK
ncbi:hypothetical protein UFOVP587_16 [uncultured Caudovirales phage]|uniref:Uncharacterized protein n=1 Tax=uncultured Caudovirales phage TaxID=2100421 RepID=A0A6J5N2B5_9CAUD|nr:hypothetical protein UFOVP587_16 [uncultured Caudovirales phage]